MDRSEKTQDLGRKAQVKSTKVHIGSMISLRHDEIHLSDGHIHKYDVIEHPGAVVIVPAQEAGIVLIRQYRYPIDQIIYELPAGCLDPNEPPTLAAQRELREETGFSAKNLFPIGSYYMAPGYTNELLHFFIATELEHDPLLAEDTDGIDVEVVTLSKALDLVYSNTIIDAKTVMGIFLYQKWHYEKYR